MCVCVCVCACVSALLANKRTHKPLFPNSEVDVVNAAGADVEFDMRRLRSSDDDIRSNRPVPYSSVSVERKTDPTPTLCIRTTARERKPLQREKLIHRKLINIVATRCHILRLKCTKFDFGWGSAHTP